MRPLLRAVLVISSIIVFVAIPTVLTVRVLQTRDSAIASAESHFSRLSGTVRTGMVSTDEKPVFPPTLASVLNPIISESQNLESLFVLQSAGAIEYAWARRPDSLPAGDNIATQRIAGLTIRSPWEQLFETTYSIDSAAVTVTGVYTVLAAEHVFQGVRDALLTVIAFALLILVALIASVATAAPVDPAAHVGGVPHAGADDRSAPDDRPEPRKTPPPQRDESTFAAESKSETTVNTHRTPSRQDSASPPLVSAISGLGFHHHLSRRLNLELQRAAENELDVSVVLLSIVEANSGSAPPTDTFGSLILEQFPFEDLAFETADADTASVILPGVDLDAALRKCTRFATLARRHDSGSYISRFGVSSRNGRLVDSARLLLEARQALERADSSSPVMGFLPDPDRYRSYVSSRMAGD